MATAGRQAPTVEWVDDRTVRFTRRVRGGERALSLSWATPELAQKNWLSAQERFESGDLDTSLSQPGQKASTYRGGPFTVRIDTGPPTWWLPRVRIGWTVLAAGWMRLGITVRWGRPSA